MSTPDTTGALEEIDRILNRGGDADEVLREVVSALTEQARYAWAGILFAEDGDLRLGPQSGEPDAARRHSVDVTWNGARVAVLSVDGAPLQDAAFLERVAALVAGHCLVGWDTGGEPWES